MKKQLKTQPCNFVSLKVPQGDFKLSSVIAEALKNVTSAVTTYIDGDKVIVQSNGDLLGVQKAYDDYFTIVVNSVKGRAVRIDLGSMITVVMIDGKEYAPCVKGAYKYRREYYLSMKTFNSIRHKMDWVLTDGMYNIFKLKQP